MKNTTAMKVTGIITAALGAVMCIGSKLVFHACAPMENGMWMNCHKAENAAFALGIVMTVLALAAVSVMMRTPRSSAAAGITAAILPNNVIHLCMMETMRCHTVMRPAVIIVGVLAAVAAAAFIAVTAKAPKDGGKA